MSQEKAISAVISKLSEVKGYAYLEVNDNPKAPIKLVETSWLGRSWRLIVTAILSLFPCCYEDSFDKVVKKLHQLGSAALAETAKNQNDHGLIEFKRRLNERAEHSSIKQIYQNVLKALEPKKEPLPTLPIKTPKIVTLPSLQTTSLEEMGISLEKTYPISEIKEKNKASDSVAGCFMGQFIGDAMGVLTEFMNKTHIKESLPEILEPNCILNYEMRQWRIEREAHNFKHLVRFKSNEWTDDSDQFICILRAFELYKCDSSQNLPILFAKELKDWRTYGIRERTEDHFKGREDPECQGLGKLVGTVLEHKNFLEKPIEAAQECWLEMGSAANGALMRTAAVALTKWHNFKELIENTKLLCKVTHADPRCIASCTSFTVAIALAMRGESNFKTIKEKALEVGRWTLKEELQNCKKNNKLLPAWAKEDFDQLCQKMDNEIGAIFNVDSWEDLELDEGYPKQPGKPERIGYTYKCLGAAFYSLKLLSQGVLFSEVFRQLVAEGGDADTNGCVAAALMGAFGGLDIIPTEWRENLGGMDVIEQLFDYIDVDWEKIDPSQRMKAVLNNPNVSHRKKKRRSLIC